MIVRFFFLSFPSFPSEFVLAHASKATSAHTAHNNPPLKSHQHSYTISAKITAQSSFFFSSLKQKKLTTALKKRERGSDRDRRRRRSTLRDETESVQCTPCGKKKLPVSLTSHRKQPHRTGCESTRHHANNTAHTEGVIPVQKQMHTASSSDVKTTCRSLRFRPHAADRVSFLVVWKTTTATLNHSTTATKTRAFGKPYLVPAFTTKAKRLRGKERSHTRNSTLRVSANRAKGEGSEEYYAIFKLKRSVNSYLRFKPIPFNGSTIYAPLLKSWTVEAQYNIPSL